MSASYCYNCQEITLVDYTEQLLDNQLITTVTCRKCHRELSRSWRTEIKTVPPYPEAVWEKDPKPCFKCKKLTHWIDIDYQGHVCSQNCQNDIAYDVRRLAGDAKYLA